MALDDGTDGPILFEGFSSASSDHEDRSKRQSKTTPTFSVTKTKRRVAASTKNNHAGTNTTRSSQKQQQQLPRPTKSKQSRHAYGKRKRSVPVTNSSNNTNNASCKSSSNNNQHKRHKNTNTTSCAAPSTPAPAPHHHHHHHRPHHHHHHHHQESRSPERFRTMEAVARLPPPQPPQHIQFQESDDTTTSTTRHLHTNNTNTTTTEITSNVHLKRRAISSNLSICSDTAEPYPNSNRHSHRSTASADLQQQQNPRRQTFYVDASAPFLSLIEGVELTNSTAMPMEKYLRRVLEGRPCNHPRIGRMMELPCEAVLGQWTAEIFTVTTNGNSHSGGGGGQHRIGLRHHSRRNLGSLKKLKQKQQQQQQNQRQTSGALMNTTAATTTNTTTTSEESSSHSTTSDNAREAALHHSRRLSNHISTHTTSAAATAASSTTTSSSNKINSISPLSVSTIHPALNRISSLDYQGIVDLDQFPTSFIGSLSVVSFDGFTSTSDMNARAAEVSTSLLERVDPKAPQPQPYPCLLGILASSPPSQNSTMTTTAATSSPPPVSSSTKVGVTAMCGLSLEQDYNVWIAQDGTLPGNPVVALDLVFWVPHPDQASSPLSSTGLVAETSNEEDEADDPFRLTEQRLKAHTLSVRSTPYDPFQRLWGNPTSGNTTNNHVNNNNNTTTKKRPAEQAITAAGGSGAVGVDIIPASQKKKAKNNHPSSPKRKKKPTIKIRNAAAIFARVNELAHKQAAEGGTQSRNPRMTTTTATIATNPTTVRKVVTPHIPSSPVPDCRETLNHEIPPSQSIIPSFRLQQQRSPQHGEFGGHHHPHHREDDGVDADEEEYEESDPTSSPGQGDDVGDNGLQSDKLKVSDVVLPRQETQPSSLVLTPQHPKPPLPSSQDAQPPDTIEMPVLANTCYSNKIQNDDKTNCDHVQIYNGPRIPVSPSFQTNDKKRGSTSLLDEQPQLPALVGGTPEIIPKLSITAMTQYPILPTTSNVAEKAEKINKKPMAAIELVTDNSPATKVSRSRHHRRSSRCRPKQNAFWMLGMATMLFSMTLPGHVPTAMAPFLTSNFDSTDGFNLFGTRHRPQAGSSKYNHSLSSIAVLTENSS